MTFQNELQMAFEISKGERRARGADSRIAEALAAGRYVVAVEIEAVCPRTDALIGYDKIFEADFATWDEADAAADALYADRGIDTIVICPPRPAAAAAAEAAEAEDVF